MMMSDVGVGLAQLLGDLCERVTFEEVKLECFFLIRCEVLYDFLPSIPAKKSLDGMVIVCSFIVGLRTFVRFVCDSGQIEALGLQASPAQQCLRISDLHNPRAARPLSTVEHRTLSL